MTTEPADRRALQPEPDAPLTDELLPDDRQHDDPRWNGCETVFACPWFTVERAGAWHRITGAGGAVALARSPRGLVFVEIYRPQTGRLHLELPRGGRDGAREDDIACALRELREETGYTAVRRDTALLGQFHPDTGLAGPRAVAAVEIAVAGSPSAGRDGEVDRVVVLSEPDVWAAVAQGRITCGITLAVLALAAARGRPAA